MTAAPIDFALLDANAFQTFSAGEKIFLEDEPGRAMYIVRSGRVDIITYGTVLENVGANGIFGEMALIDDGPRSAAAIASVDTEVAALDKAQFLELVRQHPQFALTVMKLLAVRLRRMNKSL